MIFFIEMAGSRYARPRRLRLSLTKPLRRRGRLVGIIGATEYVVNTPKLLYRSTPQDCDYSHMTSMSVRSFNLNEGLRIPVSINLIQLLYVHFSRPWNCNPFFHIPPARVQDIQN